MDVLNNNDSLLGFIAPFFFISPIPCGRVLMVKHDD